MYRHLKTLAIMLLALLFLGTTDAIGAPVQPPAPTTSWYVYVTSNEKDSALYTWMYNTGKQYGGHSVKPQGFVVLDFGQPWKSGQAYGTWSFDPRFGRFLSTSTIQEAVKQYIRGFAVGAITAGSSGFLWLGVGTNNNGPFVTEAHGQAWANMMASIQAWLDESGVGERVLLRTASDIELGYSTPDKVASWFEGYEGVPGAGSIFVYNYGDAQGCPQAGSSAIPKPCSGKPGWSQEKITYHTLLTIPEIYSTAGGNAKQWQQLVLYYYLRYNYKPTPFGAMSQRQACQQKGGCQGIDNTPAQAWTQLRNRLASDPRTLSNDPYFSTDIKWRK